MDKRYFLIIAIVLVCLVNMYAISQFSDVVGSASVNVGDYTCSIPENFNLMNSYGDYVVINNPNSGLYVAIYYYNDSTQFNFSKGSADLVNNPSNTVLSNGTINIGDVNIESIYYSHHDSSSDVTNNRSVFYFEKDNVSFKVNMENFDYKNDRDKTIEVLSFIVNSLRPNYKR